MPISAKIREQLINSFRAEIAEHVQSMTNGLLSIEQQRVEGEARQALMGDIFRAAHSLKGAARAMGVTMIEQLAHALEDILSAIQRDAITLTPELFTACYLALDAIHVVQSAYESGETTPPSSTLVALANLDPFRPVRTHAPVAAPSVVDSSNEAAPPLAEALPVAALPPTASPVAVPPTAMTPPQPSGKADLPPNGGMPVSSPASSPIEPAPGMGETIRVSASKLDMLMARLSELLVTKIRAEQRLEQIQQAQQVMAAWQKDWQAARSAYGRLTRKGHDIGLWFGTDRILRRSVDSLTARGLINEERTHGAQLSTLTKDLAYLLNYVNQTQERLREMTIRMDVLSREYASDTMHMSLVIDALEQEIKRVRMLPLSTITTTFGRMVRDLAQAGGKEAVLEIRGGDVELDKRVLEQIKDPLIHLLRNAVDHGLERPEQRQAIGKPRSGHVTLSAEHQGKDVVLRVIDDGAGLDFEAIRRAAARRGQADSPSLSKEDLQDLIFNAGITTNPIITDVSGRGVGLDIVRRNVETLRGRIEINSLPGGGTQFAMTLPLTLTSSRGLLVKASNELFAIPHNSIGRILTVVPDEITSLEGQDTIRYSGRPMTLVHLSDVLDLPRAAPMRAGTRLTVLVLVAAERRMAFVVDDLVGEQDVVIMGLGKQLQRVGGVAGATLLGNGEAVLILNVADLIKLALRGGHRPAFMPAEGDAAAPRVQKRVLIVDDSITTRTLEKNILEAAGYLVQLATDGQEALDVMASETLPDLIVSDISMPRLDGFGLTRFLKSESRTTHLPIILVTSLDSSEDKARGIEAGADAYIIKSSFDQNNLLETIEQLI